MGQIEQLRQWVNESENIVFFGGAGVSTESGIPDSEAWMAFITSSTTILRKRYSATLFTGETPRNFIVFIGIRCSALTRSPMPLT